MTFIEFLKIFGRDTLIDMRNVVAYFNGLDRRRLYEWQKKGLIQKIVSNFYIIPSADLDSRALKHISCKIYTPSYIGLASALSWYHFIPEAVFQTTAITTRRNRFIPTQVGDFRYCAIKPELFFGINIAGESRNTFFISDPEKTILDQFYFTPNSDHQGVLDEMRLNVTEIRLSVNRDKIKDYALLFASPKINRALHRLMEMMDA